MGGAIRTDQPFAGKRLLRRRFRGPFAGERQELSATGGRMLTVCRRRRSEHQDMRPLAGMPCALLEQPVFDAHGHLLGRVAAVGTRHGELHRIGIERSSRERGQLRFVARERLTVEPDRVVVTP